MKFAKDDDAAKAIEKMNGSTMGHKVLKVSVARPPSLEIRNCKLYVTNLPKEFGEREVINLFQEVSMAGCAVVCGQVFMRLTCETVVVVR